jgi:hypothetical protein
VGRLVDGHSVDIGFEISAVIQVVAAHQVLVSLALAAMRGDRQAGNGFEKLAGTIRGGELNFLVVDHALAGADRGAEQVLAWGCGDIDLAERQCRGRLIDIRNGRCLRFRRMDHCNERQRADSKPTYHVGRAGASAWEV